MAEATEAKTTKAQLKWYVDYIKSHPQIINGKITPADPQVQKRLWDEVAHGLNAMYGPQKTVAKWKECLSNWKKQLRSRARKIKAERLRTGGGSFMAEELSELEKQALSAFSMGATEGVDGTSWLFPETSDTAMEEEYLENLNASVASNSGEIDQENSDTAMEEEYLEDLNVSVASNSGERDQACAASLGVLSASPAASSSRPLHANQKVTKDMLYKLMADDMQKQRRRDETLSSALMQIGKGMEAIDKAMEILGENL